MVVESCFLLTGGGDIGLSSVVLAALLSLGRVLMASVHGQLLYKFVRS